MPRGRPRVGVEIKVRVPDDLLDSIDKGRGRVPRAVVIRAALEQVFLPGAQRIRASSGVCAPLNEKAEAERIEKAKQEAMACPCPRKEEINYGYAVVCGLCGKKKR